MSFLRDTPIKRKVMLIILLASGFALFLMGSALITYELITFRQSLAVNIGVLAEIIGSNSTASLAFDNPDDAREVLSAFRAQPHVVAARLYLSDGRLVASYPDGEAHNVAARSLGEDGYRFGNGLLMGVQPVVQGTRRMGTLYLESDLGEIYEHFRLFGMIGALVLLVCCLAAYLISRRLQQYISEPILALARTAQVVSERRDYSVRATKPAGHEFGLLTDAFNHMLTRIEGGQTKLHSQLSRLDLLHRITRATGERHDLHSIFKVVLHNIEEDLPIDFGCMSVYEAGAEALCIAAIGAKSSGLASELALAKDIHVPIDQNGLARCVAGYRFPFRSGSLQQASARSSWHRFWLRTEFLAYWWPPGAAQIPLAVRSANSFGS